MALHIYQGAVTAGGTDGTLVSAGDESSPIIIDGLYPSGSTAKKVVKFAIRSGEGEIYDDVYLYLVGTDSVNVGFTSDINGGAGEMPHTLMLRNIAPINRIVYLYVQAPTSQQNTTDTSVNILVETGIKRIL